MNLLRHYWAVLAVLIAAGGFLLGHVAFHVPVEPQHWANDWIIKWFSPTTSPHRGDVVLVLIDDNTLANYPYIAPINRELLAELVRRLDELEVRTIGLDFVFNRDTEKNKDDDLKQAIKEARVRVVLGKLDERTRVSAEERKKQDDFIAAVNREAGHLYFDREPASPLVITNDVIRLIAQPGGHGSLPSFAEAIAQRKFFAGHDHEEEYIAWLLPSDQSETFQTWPAETIINNPQGGPIDLKRYLADKIVLVGGNFHDRDQHLTPLSVLRGERFPGVAIHAQIVTQLLDERRLRALGWSAWSATLLLCFAIGFWVGRRYDLGIWDFTIEVLIVLMVVGVSSAAFQYGSRLLPSTYMILCSLAGVAGGRHSKSMAH